MPGLRLQNIEFQHERRKQQDDEIPACGNSQCVLGKLPEVIFSRLQIPRPNTLSDDGDEHRPHGYSRQSCQRPDALSHSVSCNLVGAKECHHAGQSYLDQLEHPILDAVGYGNGEDAAHKACIPPENKQPTVENLVFLLKAQKGDSHRRKQAGKQGRISYASHSGIKNEYADEIADHVDDIGKHRDIHGGFRPAHAALQGCPGVIDGQSRIRIGRDFKIGDAGFHHLRLHPAEKQA